MHLLGVHLLITLALGACSSGAAGDEPYSAVEFGTDRTVSVEDFDGSPVLLAGWATWCVPCERELPELDGFVDERLANGADDLVVVAVNVDDPSIGDDAVTAMLERLDVSLPVWRDADGALLTRFDGTSMPFSVLLDDQGDVVRTWIGALDVDDDEFLATIATVSG